MKLAGMFILELKSLTDMDIFQNSLLINLKVVQELKSAIRKKIH